MPKSTEELEDCCCFPFIIWPALFPLLKSITFFACLEQEMPRQDVEKAPAVLLSWQDAAFAHIVTVQVKQDPVELSQAMWGQNYWNAIRQLVFSSCGVCYEITYNP